MEGMTREQIICTGLALLEVLVACALLPFAATPNETALCAVAALCGLVAFWLGLEQ